MKMLFSHVTRIAQHKKNRFLGQKVCPVARSQTHRQTTEGTLSGLQDIFLQPIIKDRPNIKGKIERLTEHINRREV